MHSSLKNFPRMDNELLTRNNIAVTLILTKMLSYYCNKVITLLALR